MNTPYRLLPVVLLAVALSSQVAEAQAPWGGAQHPTNLDPSPPGGTAVPAPLRVASLLRPTVLTQHTGQRTARAKASLTLYVYAGGVRLGGGAASFAVYRRGERERPLQRRSSGGRAQVEAGRYDVQVAYKVDESKGEQWLTDFRIEGDVTHEVELGVPVPAERQEAALRQAFRSNDLSQVRRLLAAGAPISTALFLEAINERTELGIVQELVGHGAEVNAVLEDATAPGMQFTPLGSAVMAGREDLVDLLLTAGADPDAVHFGDSVVNWAYAQLITDKGNAALFLKLLQAGATFEEKENLFGWNPLYIAARGGNAEAVATLLGSGADPNVRTASGETPLHVAALTENLAVVTALLDAGADPSASDDGGRTVLMQAARSGGVEIVEMLLDAGADPDAHDDNGQHAISYARGYDPVSSLLEARSEGLAANRAAPRVEAGGSYAPGLYGAACEMSGAPPPSGVPGDDNGTLISTSTKIRGPHGLEASVAAPECAPVELTEPGPYSAYVMTCSSAWSTNNYELRQTTGEVTTLVYIKKDPVCSDATFPFTISPDAPPPAADDPCRTPRFEIATANNEEQFSFDAADPGRLEIQIEARVFPEDCAEEIRWTATGVEGSRQTFEPVDGAGDGEAVRLVYERLPESNDAFGSLTIRAEMGKQVRDVEVEIFYDPRATNHPGEGAGETPNWFYYWGKTSAGRGFDLTYVSSLEPCGGGVPAARYVFEEDKLYITDHAARPGGCVARTGGGASEGIDCFAELARHENHHRVELHQWWPVEVGVEHHGRLGNTHSQTRFVNPPGCGWGSVLSNLNKKLAGIDSDLDLVPDVVEERLAATRGCRKDQARSCTGRPPHLDVRDVEMNAYTVGWQWQVGSAKKEDWSRCGKQWAGGGCP